MATTVMAEETVDFEQRWKPVRKLDFDNKASQEQLLKTCIIEYFKNL